MNGVCSSIITIVAFILMRLDTILGFIMHRIMTVAIRLLMIMKIAHLMNTVIIMILWDIIGQLLSHNSIMPPLRLLWDGLEIPRLTRLQLLGDIL